MLKLATVLLCLCCLVSGLMARERGQWVVAPDVNDLDDFNVTPNSPSLNHALIEASQYVLRWRAPESPEQWRERKPVVRREFLEAIGLDRLPRRTPLNPRVVATHDMGDYTLSNVIFYSRPDFPVTANLYRPKNAKGRLPAVVCPIGHALDTGKRDKQIQMRCIGLAKLGYVVLVYDAIGHGERAVPGNNHHEGGFALLPTGQTVAGWMVWDSMRALDYLCTLPEVDSTRVGITGNSGGGLNCLFTSAVDSRFAATALAGYVFHFNNWIRYSGAHCTCCALPGLYRRMEWFEIAGLIAPRALLMMQGGQDDIFPISGARIAGRLTEGVFALEGAAGRARFDEFAGFHHGYWQPFREAMYGWMEKYLAGRGSGEPVPEGDFKPLDENDPRLLCDPDGKIMAAAKTVVDFAGEIADTLIPPSNAADYGKEKLLDVVRALSAPPRPEPDHLMPLVLGSEKLDFARLEKVYFLSEIGQYIPGLLWLPPDSSATPLHTVVIVDGRGKASVAGSGLVQPLVEKGYAVLSVDLRGRGETLGRIGDQRDNNYHFAWFSILWGRPLAGRRAYDLTRTVDFIESREDLSTDGLTLVGLGDEVPAVLLAAGVDQRIAGVVCTEFMSTFRAMMQPVDVKSREEYILKWNTGANRWGRIDGPHGDFDLGDVIPGFLQFGDIPELVALSAPRPLLYGRIIDGGQEGTLERIKRFQTVLSGTESAAAGREKFYPDLIFNADKLMEWMADNGL